MEAKCPIPQTSIHLDINSPVLANNKQANELQLSKIIARRILTLVPNK